MDLGDTHREMRQDLEEDEHADGRNHRAHREGGDGVGLEVILDQFQGIARCGRSRPVGEDHFCAINDARFDMHSRVPSASTRRMKRAG